MRSSTIAFPWEHNMAACRQLLPMVLPSSRRAVDLPYWIQKGTYYSSSCWCGYCNCAFVGKILSKICCWHCDRYCQTVQVSESICNSLIIPFCIERKGLGTLLVPLKAFGHIQSEDFQLIIRYMHSLIHLGTQSENLGILIRYMHSLMHLGHTHGHTQSEDFEFLIRYMHSLMH